MLPPPATSAPASTAARFHRHGPAAIVHRYRIDQEREMAMTPDGYDLGGKTAIVTGGGEGIGAATALLLARYGADVVIAGRTEATLARTSRSIADATGRRCLGVPTDVRDEEQVQRLVSKTTDQFGRIDILINNVGWSVPGPLSKMGTSAWREDFTLNVDTAFFCTKAVGAHMRAQKSGSIVNTSSVAGESGVMGFAGYSAAKAALQMFTRVAAAEWGPHGIRVNCVAPGMIATENAMKEFAAANLDIDAICAGMPLRRAGKPEEVARAIVFLASDAASYITGTTLLVTGGPPIGGSGD
jgi:3-oxoacyl-[acyl-carrier protein] reductase